MVSVALDIVVLSKLVVVKVSFILYRLNNNAGGPLLSHSGQVRPRGTGIRDFVQEGNCDAVADSRLHDRVPLGASWASIGLLICDRIPCDTSHPGSPFGSTETAHVCLLD